jgi:hypothetical protein
MDEDVIEEIGDYRVRLVADADPFKPDWDGQAFVLQVNGDPWSYDRVESANDNSDSDTFVDAWNHFAEGYSRAETLEVFERYVRIFHGTKSLVTWNLGITREYGYVVFDTAALREEWDITDEYADNHPGTLAQATLDEWRNWAEGDVYGYIVEKKEFWSKEYARYGVVYQTEEGWDWEEVDSCWGFSGREYAEQAAKEALKDAMPRGWKLNSFGKVVRAVGPLPAENEARTIEQIADKFGGLP